MPVLPQTLLNDPSLNPQTPSESDEADPPGALLPVALGLGLPLCCPPRGRPAAVPILVLVLPFLLVLLLFFLFRFDAVRHEELLKLTELRYVFGVHSLRRSLGKQVLPARAMRSVPQWMLLQLCVVMNQWLITEKRLEYGEEMKSLT